MALGGYMRTVQPRYLLQYHGVGGSHYKSIRYLIRRDDIFAIVIFRHFDVKRGQEGCDENE